MFKILAVAPDFSHGSNGHVAYTKILWELRRRGHDVRCMRYAPAKPSGSLDDFAISFGPDGNLCEEFPVPYLRPQDWRAFLDQSSIVLYPETVVGNPLRFPRVARYLGNREGVLTGKGMAAASSDFLIAHSSRIRPDAHAVLFYSGVNPVFWHGFKAPLNERRLDLTYAGKGDLYGKCVLVPETVLLARSWPRRREEVATMLGNTRFLFTWDCWTNVIPEAIICGAIPVICRFSPFSLEDLHNVEIGPVPLLSLDDSLFNHASRDKVYASLDLHEFERARMAMIHRIIALEDSWGARVDTMNESLIRYFSK